MSLILLVLNPRAAPFGALSPQQGVTPGVKNRRRGLVCSAPTVFIPDLLRGFRTADTSSGNALLPRALVGFPSFLLLPPPSHS